MFPPVGVARGQWEKILSPEFIFLSVFFMDIFKQYSKYPCPQILTLTFYYPFFISPLSLNLKLAYFLDAFQSKLYPVFILF